MSASSLLPIFRSELQLRVLGLVLLNADRPWTTPEIAERLDVTPLSVHRELHRALDAGLLEREAIGKMYLYRAASNSPLYEPLRLLLERTVGVEPELRRALEEIPGVEAAFIHGSFATGTKIRPNSDVDVLVLGNADPHVLRRRLRLVENLAGREVDLIAYTPDEFASLARSGNGLARGIIRGPVKTLVGDLSALAVQ